MSKTTVTFEYPDDMERAMLALADVMREVLLRMTDGMGVPANGEVTLSVDLKDARDAILVTATCKREEY